MARTERYLPVSSHIVVANGVPAHQYDTKKEVVITDDTPSICPLTGDGVRTVTVSGVQLWFASRLIRSRIVLEENDVNEATFNEQFSLFHYDVPSNGDSAGYSPCAELYRVAVRLTKSAWIVKTGDVPYDLMGRMQDIGCRVFCNKFDRTETRSLMLQAVEQLQEKMVEATTDAQAAYDRAVRQLENSGDAESDDYLDSEEKAVERFTKRTALIAKRLEKMAEDISTGATKFGISGKAYNHDQLRGMSKLTHDRTQQQATAYHRGTQALAMSTDSTATALVASAITSQLPVAVMADALREAGNEEAADELNETFSLLGTGEDD